MCCKSCKKSSCGCRYLMCFNLLTVLSLLIGSAQFCIGCVIHVIRFKKFVTDEWFTEFFAITCGVLVMSVSLYALHLSVNQIQDRQNKFKNYTYFILIPLFYQCLTGLMVSLPIMYRNPNQTLPAHIPGSIVHRPTYERIMYVRIVWTLNILSWSHIFIGIVYWYFTVCYINTEEILEDEFEGGYEYFRDKERGRFASTRSLKTARRV